jgi:hypothetical protein
MPDAREDMGVEVAGARVADRSTVQRWGTSLSSLAALNSALWLVGHECLSACSKQN